MWTHAFGAARTRQPGIGRLRHVSDGASGLYRLDWSTALFADLTPACRSSSTWVTVSCAPDRLPATSSPAWVSPDHRASPAFSAALNRCARTSRTSMLARSRLHDQLVEPGSPTCQGHFEAVDRFFVFPSIGCYNRCVRSVGHRRISLSRPVLSTRCRLFPACQKAPGSIRTKVLVRPISDQAIRATFPGPSDVFLHRG